MNKFEDQFQAICDSITIERKMTVRDLFASKAMQAIVQAMLMEGNRTSYDIKDIKHLDAVAADAYAIADAMLRAGESE